MTAHRAQVFKDGYRWVSVCDCASSQTCSRWRDCYDNAFTHVRRARRIEQIGGVGFGVSREQSVSEVQ